MTADSHINANLHFRTILFVTSTSFCALFRPLTFPFEMKIPETPLSAFQERKCSSTTPTFFQLLSPAIIDLLDSIIPT
jgi:hypothetical protein